MERYRPCAHVPLHPLQQGEDGVGGGQPLVGGGLCQVMTDDAEGEGHPLQRVDRVLVRLVVAGENNSDSEIKFLGLYLSL